MKIKFKKQMLLFCCVAVNLLLITGCKNNVTNVYITPNNPVLEGTNVTITANCNANCTANWYLYYNNHYYGPTSCTNLDESSASLATFTVLAESSTIDGVLSCENGDAILPGHNAYIRIRGTSNAITLVADMESITAGESAVVTASVAANVTSSITMAFIAESSGIISFPSGTKCTIASGSRACSVPVLASTNIRSSESTNIVAVSANYVYGHTAIVVDPVRIAHMFLTESPVTTSQIESSANNICNHDPHALPGYTYRAFLATAESNIWINARMKANTTYYRTDLVTPILTTNNDGEPPISWTNNVDASSFGNQFWSGQASMAQQINEESATCSSWMDHQSGGSVAILGIDEAHHNDNWNGNGSFGRIVCSGQSLLMCVSQ